MQQDFIWVFFIFYFLHYTICTLWKFNEVGSRIINQNQARRHTRICMLLKLCYAELTITHVEVTGKSCDPMEGRSLRLALLGWRHCASSLIPVSWRSSSFIEIPLFLHIFWLFRYSGTCNHAHRRCCRVKVPLCCRLFLMPNFLVINNHLFFLQETLLLFLDSTRKYIRNLDFGIARLYTSKKLCIKGGYPIHSLISIGHLITFYWKGKEGNISDSNYLFASL